ncbi:DUF3857 domain-containing protein [Neotamlana laminarinivorans]|uniref:DUF3857 domain-containing protein n=1 Tax=Neotamlana laminarinivorans TaxID=2883124 RepID=A0A9X1L3N0_9FLAO|nr:DUF3857 domain-containing protein [Tamlana laminarinivorans]MCB4798629.1 DUF3857 domain-containing protein [Tamlana laminarinivorans]
MVKLKTFSCLLFLVASLSFSQENLQSSYNIPNHLTTSANAVIRLNDINISINAVDAVTITEKRIVTVLNENGNSSVNAYSGYDKYYKIKKIEAFIYDASGKEVEHYKKKDFIDHSAVDGGTLYSDSRVLYMGYTPVNYPYTVEFTCEIETSNSAGIPSWMPMESYYLSVENSKYNLIDNANLGLRFKEKFFEGYNINSNTSTNALNYSLENVKALKPEDLSPTFSEFTPKVMVAVDQFQFYGYKGKAKNWLEFGDWVNTALLQGRDVVSDETKQKILELTNGVSDPIEKAKIVFDFVQNNTRYISVQVGIGGVQPIPALEVDQLKYGDCKGLTNYTKALLNVVGVTSYYSVVEAGKDIIGFEPDFASLAQGNHIILAIPKENNDLIWVDCTSQIHPFNFIGDFTDNRNVLMVKPNGSEIVRTTVYSDTLNLQKTNATIKLNANGSISANLNIKTKGTQYDNRFYIERQASKDIIEYYKETWDYVNNLEVDTYNFTNNKNDVEFTETLNLTARDYASLNGNRVFFPLNAFNKNTFVPKRYASRKLPVDIQRGYLDEDEFVYEIPKGYEIEAIPEAVEITNKYGVYNISAKKEGDNIVYKRKLLIKSGRYNKQEYTAYRDFRKQVAKNDNAKIVLKKAI